MSRSSPPRGLALAFSTFVAVTGASAADGAAHQILARVDGQPILAWDAEHFLPVEADGRDPPKPGTSGAPAETWEQLKRRNEQKLEDLIDRRLLLAECRRTGRRASDAEVLRQARARFPYHWLPARVNDLLIDLSDREYDGFSSLSPRPQWRPIPRDPTESEIDATRERLCLARLLEAEATAPIRRGEARAWYLAHPVQFALATPFEGGAWVFLPFERARREVERSMRGDGPAATRARIVERLRQRAKITSGP